MRFHHVTQNGTPLKTYELFISGIFHLILLGVTEAKESKTVVGRDYY
jgi:hypothetical protein